MKKLLSFVLTTLVFISTLLAINPTAEAETVSNTVSSILARSDTDEAKLSPTNPTGTPTKDLRICNDSIGISEEYILTSVYPRVTADKVLSRYNPKSGFSGVYNIITGDWIALPSEGAFLEKDQDKGDFCTVKAQGGHSEVQRRFNERISDKKLPPLNSHKNLGFFIQLNPNKDETLDLRFISGKINCCYYKNRGENPSREVPEKYQDAIKNDIETTVGYKVEKQEYRKNKCCKDDDLRNCDN
ncbi:hypothetical protein NUACC21_77850 [Scytonema sp. NUACC21]